MAASFLHHLDDFHIIEETIGVIYLIEYAARLYVSRERLRFVFNVVGVVNLSVFVFVMTAIVYVLQAGRNENISNYVDALYFTVATLTTTGFGDIALVGTGGHMLAVLIMIFGISLFVRLIQTIFRPEKVRFECVQCGLVRHDNDAVHCKHCGNILHIPTAGSG